MEILPQLKKFLNNFGAYLIVDEAHACGIMGQNGKGIVQDLGLSNKIFARIITFGKAYGAHGAAILGSQELKDFLINFARSFIYTTALPPDSYNRIEQVILQSSSNTERNKLQHNIKKFRNLINLKSSVSNVYSPIQMIRIGDVERTKNLTELLLKNQFAVKPIYRPTVKIGEEGIRICIHSFNTIEEIRSICTLITNQLNLIQ
jgi:8-amino-7-oxononanoate synthase